MSFPYHTCLPLFDSACLLTMFINKAQQMDPLASCLVGSVTEYSATQGSSSFSEEHWPGMDTSRILLALKQGPRSLENYIQEYLAIAYYSDLPDCLLIEFFCDGINQPLRSKLISEGPRSSLCQFMDYALLCVGSSFTVGVADEERNTALTHVMAAALDNEHKMAVTAEPNRKMAITVDFHESSQVIVNLHESSQITADLHESSQVTVDRRESSQVTVDRRESSQVTVDRHELSQVTVDRHELSQVTFDRHESSHVSADLPESLHVSADLPESLHFSAHLPESLHVSADLPESLHVTVDHPESCHVLSITPRYSRSVLRFPSLVSSVRDAPLVSACAAGIPKPNHSNPPVPELIPLSKVLPMMGIVFWCAWAAYTTTELPETAVSTMMSLEVAAEAAEPPEVVALATAFPEAMVPATVSPEVAAHAAEPPEAAVLASAPCLVVAPSNALSACQVTIQGTFTEFSAFVQTPESTAVELLEVAASAAEPLEVSVVSTYESSSCPVTAMEAVCESSSCPVTAMEAVYESSSCSVTAMEIVCELLPCVELAMDAINEPPLPMSQPVMYYCPALS